VLASLPYLRRRHPHAAQKSEESQPILFCPLIHLNQAYLGALLKQGGDWI
jgi:hypothetical protein